jgi:uncharacterized protein (UPF0276 family)
VRPFSFSGVGIGLRRAHYETILTTERRVDWLEIAPENYIGRGGRPDRVLAQCAERWPIMAHGVSLSLGGPDPLDRGLLEGIKGLTARLRSPYYTEHACLARAGGAQFHDLIPVPWNDEAVRHMAARIRQAAEIIERPVAVENVSTYCTMPGSTMSEQAFVRAVCEEADCGLLLDVNNVYVNARNHGRDPVAALDELPLARTRYIHLAGFLDEGWVVIDTHGAPVAEEVWRLYRAALERVGPVPTLIEWDLDIPALDVVLDQADRARRIQQEVA